MKSQFFVCVGGGWRCSGVVWMSVEWGWGVSVGWAFVCVCARVRAHEERYEHSHL